MGLRRPRPTYANVVSSLALFVALGGTSYAVARNSVGTRELKNNAVTSAKVRNGALQKGDLARSARIGERGPRGPQGPAGTGGTTDAAPEAWHALDFIGGWGNYPSTPQVYEAGSYRKDAQGNVWLRGLVSRIDGLPADSKIIAVLPAGYRPKLRHVLTSNGGNPDAYTRVDILPDGSLMWVLGPNAETDFTTLTGLSFPTD
jgi:hypothetical protein